MRKLPVASVRQHAPQMHRDILFLVTKGLNAECPALASGIRGVEKMNSSRWRVQITDDKEGLQPAAPADTGAKRQPAALKADAKKQRQPGGPKAQKKEEVLIPDLSTMWRWLQRNRASVNAKHTRMCWRGNVPTPL